MLQPGRGHARDQTLSAAGRPAAEQLLRRALVDFERASVALSEARRSLGSDRKPAEAPTKALTDEQDQARRLAYVAIRTCHDEIDTATDALRQAVGDAG